uniref:TBC1 domain family member 2B n=1 Tax=Meloidogyne incognita TaxID=6306 RepID=A0A914KP71_MELIC
MYQNDIENEPESNLRGSRMDGYLYKHEQRPIVGLTKKKYWFVLPKEAPVLYWYKSPSDFNCAGRIVLSGAAFTFNPRDSGIFEIHVDNECYILEAPDNKFRIEWLSSLQYNRKQYYQQNSKDNSTEIKISENSQGAVCSKSDQLDKSPTSLNRLSRNLDRSIDVSEPKSVFYLNENGGLHPGSLEIPPPICNIQSIENLINKVNDETNQLDLTTKLFRRTRNSLRNNSQSSHCNMSNFAFPQPRENCDKCAEFLKAFDQLRNKCFELTDDLVVYQDLVNSLKRSVVSAHNEKEALQQYCVDASSDMDKLAFVLEREQAFTDIQFTASELRRDIETLKADNRQLEFENNSLNVTVEAYQESVRTKEELILRLVDQNSIGVPVRNSIRNRSTGHINISPEVPEALLVDYGTPTDYVTKNVLAETAVSDLNEMHDLIEGYKNQNNFLNNEVIELQRIIQSLEERERRLIRQNFSLEAFYYQMKSRYVMLLNHFRSSDQPPKRVIEPSVIQNLVEEVSRPLSPFRANNSNTLASETLKSRAALSTAISNPEGIPVAAFEDLNAGILQNADPETDSLGFYLTPQKSRKSDNSKNACQEPPKDLQSPGEVQINSKDDQQTVTEQNTCKDDFEQTDPSSSVPSTSYFAYFNELKEKPAFFSQNKDVLLRLAADSQKRADDILSLVEPGNNQEFVNWLARWDSFLVNHVSHPLSPDPNLKALVRCGVPHAYRRRVWSGLVDFHVGSTQVEAGNGYYECLLRKSQKLLSEDDAALKQIDLDLARTLPNNKLFETEQSPKAGALRNILYAFRFHNKSVEYCQGLNRIGAIGLLYLEESEAFWFLVASVEHLQPLNYYSSNLVGAVIDQRVLLDLVQDKMPALHAHLQKLEVNLSLFTLSWFLTVFVDVLSHTVYIKIFDVFLYEGNKVLFRFALAILRLVELRLLECNSFSGVHTCLSNLSSIVTDYKALAKIAFNHLNPFPSRLIESRRQSYYFQHRCGKFNI